jgi:CubicO group peptidase (beta-lactamase class C family)
VGTPEALGQPAVSDTYIDSPEIPSTPAASHVRPLLDALNSGDSDRMREFINTHFAPSFRDRMPIEDHVEILMGIYEMSKGLDFHGIRAYEPPLPETELVVICRNRMTEAWMGISIKAEPDPPHKIGGLLLSPARPPTDLPPPKPLSESEMLHEIGAFLDRLEMEDAFSGSVLIAKDGEVLYSRACGVANKSCGMLNRLDTKFNLGSMNKMFTAVSIGQLVERELLRYEDPIGKFIGEDWLPASITGQVQVQHLLCHTSGLGSYFNEEYHRKSRALLREIEDYKPLVEGDTLMFEPGTGWQYSNTGFLLLGAIIEKVTGGSYFDYVRENIYEPAGMINSDCYEMDLVVENLAVGYTREKQGNESLWRNNLFIHVIKGGPAGGGFSTVEDLFHFDRAMRAAKLVSAATAEILWAPKPDLGSDGYGFGFGISGEPGNRVVGHGGGFPGISSQLDMYLDTGYTVAVMSNYDMGAQTVNQKIRGLIGVGE